MHRRQFLTGAAALAAVPLSARLATAAELPFDAVVTRDTAPVDGVPAYDSVAAAIAAAPREPRRAFRISVARGRWHEKLVIDRPAIELLGDPRGGSVLSYDAAAGQRGPDGSPWGTWGCASVTVRAPDFRARDLTIENAFDYVGNLVRPQFEAIGPNGPQAVALMLADGSDRACLDRVEIIGHQDTLFADGGRSRFRACVVRGSVDFIFGAGSARFEDCEIQSRFRPGKERQGYVAAPSTPSDQAAGLVFENCRLTREPQVPDHSVALGRAWRPTRDFPDGRYGDPGVVGAAYFLDCWIDAHVGEPAWDPMAYTARDGSRVMFEPRDARFGEWRSRGPGALRSAARLQLDAAARHAAAAAQMFGDWRPGDA